MQTKEVLLNRASAVRELFKTIKIRKICSLGHALSGDRYKILQLLMKGKIEARRGIGKKQL